MNKTSMFGLKLWGRLKALRSNCEGQDLIEYSLMAGFIVCGVITLAPQIAESFVTVMSKTNSVLISAGSS